MEDTSLQVLKEMFISKDWFHSVDVDNFGRLVVYVKYQNADISENIPDHIDGKQILVHFADYKTAYKEKYCNIINLTGPEPELNIDELKKQFEKLHKEYFPAEVMNTFYNIHDGNVNYSALSTLENIILELYNRYGFDIIASEIYN